MTTRRPARHTPSPTPLLSHSTLTFLGHWRGQLLITTIVLVIGFIYFIIRDPIERWRRRRREASSARARGALLAEVAEVKRGDDEREKEESAPQSAVGGGNAQSGQSADRGRGGKKDAKRRKGSLLRVQPDSADSSPAPRGRKSSSAGGEPMSAATPHTADIPTPSAKGKGKAKPNAPSRQASTITTPQIRLKAPTDDVTPPSVPPMAEPTPSTPSPAPASSTPLTSLAVEAWSIPLPASPQAGPSRLTLPPAPASISSASTDGRSDIDSAEQETDEKERRASQGFSIFPEDGYLPPSALQSGKKKKRGKGKGGANGSASTSGTGSPGPSSAALPTEPIPQTPTTPRLRRDRATSTTTSLSLIPESTSPTSSFRPSLVSPPPTPSRAHLRKASLGGRPFGMDLEDLLLEREKTIDALRAEIGVAKAEGAKAREDAERARQAREEGIREMEGVRKAGGQIEADLRRREVDLQRQLSHTNQLLSAQAARLQVIEQLIASTGLSLPPPPSPLPSFPNGHAHSRISSMPASPMPSSPYTMAYPSPMANGRGMGSPMMAYPSPIAALGMFPQGQTQPGGSQGMLHPSFASHNPHSYQLQLQQQHHLHQSMQPSLPSPGRQPPSPGFRRSSSATEPDHPLAGPLTPGLVPIGLGRPKSATATAQSPVYRLPGLPVEYPDTAEGGDDGDIEAGAKMDVGAGVGIGGEMDDETRASIAFSVMKPKAVPGKVEGEGEGAVEGLGMGVVGAEGGSVFSRVDGGGEVNGKEEAIKANGNGVHSTPIDADIDLEVELEINDGHSDSNSSHPTSTSPSPKRLLVTPGPSAPECVNGHTHTNGNANGHGHGEEGVVIRDGRGSRSSSGSGRGRLGLLEGVSANGKAEAAEPEVYTPTFASLAHTPEQLKEIARMREMALRRYASSGPGSGGPGLGLGERRGSTMSMGSVGSGQGR